MDKTEGKSVKILRESQLKKGENAAERRVVVCSSFSRRCIKRRHAPYFVQLVINELFLLSAARAITWEINGGVRLGQIVNLRVNIFGFYEFPSTNCDHPLQQAQPLNFPHPEGIFPRPSLFYLVKDRLQEMQLTKASSWFWHNILYWIFRPRHEWVLADFGPWRQNVPANMGNHEQCHQQTEQPVRQLQIPHPWPQGTPPCIALLRLHSDPFDSVGRHPWPTGGPIRRPWKAGRLCRFGD